MKIENLVKEIQRIDSNGSCYYVPHKTENIKSLYKRTSEFFSEPSKNLIILVDSLNYFEFEKHFRNAFDLTNLEALTSVMPTGTSCAFSSIFLNANQQEHGIYGIAFYLPEYKGIFQTNKGAIVDSYNKILQKIDYFSITRTSILDTAKQDTFFVHLDDYWFKSNFWQRLLGKKVNKIPVQSSMNYSDLDSIKLEVDRVLDSTNQLMNSKENRTVISFIDYDGPIHSNGVKTKNSQELLRYLAEKISQLLINHKDYNFAIMSDHGQIDLHNTFEFKFEEISDLCYTNRGGLGRTLYFYSKRKEAYEKIAEKVGDSGLVLLRDDPLLSEIFGYDVSNIPQIGDIVAIAIKDCFPSFGWNFAAEHGGLSKEEMIVPFLRINKTE